MKDKNQNLKDSKKAVSNSSKPDIWALIILIILILDLQFIGFFGRTTFIRDWTIIFDGAYRISYGQIPFQDFYIPIGPVVFLMQGFFNFIFGANMFSMAIHSLTLSIILVLIFYYFVRKEFNIFISFIFSLFFYISFSGLTFHPFYNYTTYFFLFLNIFLIFYYINRENLPVKVYIISAILGVLDFYTKQDTGALHLALIFIYFIINYRKDWKKILICYLVPAAILAIGVFLTLSTLDGFPYWYNLGQPPHSPNIQKIFEPMKIVMITSSWHFYISILFILIILFLKINNYKKRIMSLFIFLAVTHLISNTLSGSTRQLSVMGMPLIIFLIYLLIEDHIRPIKNKYKIAFSSILIFLLFLSTNPIPTYGLVTLNYLNPNISHVQEGCVAGMPMHKEHLQSLQEIREIIREEPNFISLTEYSFLYCDYDVQPPREIPLVFQEGIHFHIQDIELIADKIIKHNPQLILIQNYHGNYHKDTNEKFIKIFESHRYRKIKTINKTATPEAPITILSKNL